ncbi:MAG TPA: hypothetical protein VK661_09340 [Planctomycetota bacterium]|jgi:hypothetical protein|nr:hypothetical protein [Planctomycetota bacterium]
MVSAPLLELADREFPFLMRHPTNREDAIQVLAITSWETQGRDTVEAARTQLSELARGLGYRKDGDRWRKAG